MCFHSLSGQAQIAKLDIVSEKDSTLISFPILTPNSRTETGDYTNMRSQKNLQD